MGSHRRRDRDSGHHGDMSRAQYLDHESAHDGDGDDEREHDHDSVSDPDSDASDADGVGNVEGIEDADEDEDEEEDEDGDEDDAIPSHPVPALQEAFEESIIEAAEDVQYETTPASATHPTAESRRQALLEQHTYDDTWISRWNQKHSARCHPLTKLVAQIIFGMHLLANHQAKSDAEVVKILQAHVDDIDGFLEKTTDDLDLAIADIEERRAFLQLPMTHLDVFDIMLEDRTFRTQLVDGNDKIEKIITRSAKAMNAAMADVQKGIAATHDLAKYLDDVGPEWPRDYSELPAIYNAMRGNQEGWLSCFQDLQLKGNRLGVVMVQLGTTIGEMSKLAAAASRRSMHGSVAPPRSKYASGGSKETQLRASRHMSRHSLDKPLPVEPDAVQPAVQATLPKPRHRHQLSFEQHFDEPSRHSHAPARQGSTSQRRISTKLQPREPQDLRAGETSVLATFIKNSGPSDSNQHSAVESGNSVSSVPHLVNDSAYSSGSDPAAERRKQKRMNTPARFGLFPDSKPATPDTLSRSTSYMTATTSPVASSPPVGSSTTPVRWTPATPKPSRHFSLRRMFHRKARTQEVV